ncbi:MAG TPA: HDOD domain-containing protein [Deltaproteobacteria bacterium]|nr:HDOD domain-containing protein [Deltaproteobacteria bacterium]
MESIIEDVNTLPTLPGIISRLTELAEDRESTIEEMARLVSSDHVLSAKILKLVNSPFYGFPGRVSTVSNALILLGVNVVKSLALSSSIFEIMEKHAVGLWEHSLGAAVAASVITDTLGMEDAEEVSTAALLHDIGKVILKIKLDERLEEIGRVAADGGISMFEAERRVLDTDHAEIGGWLARRWYLPEQLVEPVMFHHAVERSSKHREKTAAVHMADILVKASGFGASGDEFVHSASPLALEVLGLDMERLEEIVLRIEDRLVEVKNFSLEVRSGDAG